VDAEIAGLAGTAATTLVTLLTTEGWCRAKDQLVSLWRLVQPERAEAIADELEAAHDDLILAQDNDESRIEEELSAEWQGRFRRLLIAHPDAVGELRALVTTLAPETAKVRSVTQHAVASGNARLYQAGRDQHFNQR
jgi:hypothetical protein